MLIPKKFGIITLGQFFANRIQILIIIREVWVTSPPAECLIKIYHKLTIKHDDSFFEILETLEK